MKLRRQTMSTALIAGLFTMLGTNMYAFDAQLILTVEKSGLKADLKAASALIKADSEKVTAPDEIIAAAQNDYRNIVGALYQAGYYGPSISIRIDGRETASLSLISLPSEIKKVVITVDPGQRFKFGKTSVSPLADGTLLPDGFAQGKTARAPLVGEAKDAAIDAWRAQSHAKASLENQSIIADHPNGTLDVSLGIDPGPVVHNGTLKFSGNTTVNAEHLQKIGNLHAGRAFDPDDISRVSGRFQNTGAFRSVSVSENEILNPDGTLDLIVNLEDAKPRRFGFGAEISSLEGGTISTYWMHRNISKHADRLRFDGEVSGIGSDTGIDYSLSISYLRPATIAAKTTLVLGVEIADIDETDYSERLAQFTIGAQVETDLASELEFDLGYRYSQVDDDLGYRKFSHFILPISGERDARDNTLNPKHGTFFSAEITPFIGINGSEDGLRLYTDARAYYSLGATERFTFAGRLQLGSIIGADETEVPPEMLFFSGGGGTVRGQPYQSLSVENTDGTTTGGTGFFGLSTEVRGEINSNFSLVGFADIGAIGANSLPTKDTEWHAGAGIGLRYNTSVGPLRLDVAAPVAGDTGDGIQIYVGIGQAF